MGTCAFQFCGAYEHWSRDWRGRLQESAVSYGVNLGWADQQTECAVRDLAGDDPWLGPALRRFIAANEGLMDRGRDPERPRSPHLAANPIDRHALVDPRKGTSSMIRQWLTCASCHYGVSSRT